MNRFIYQAADEAATVELGAALAELLPDGTTVALCGSLGPGAERTLAEGVQAMFSLCPGPMTEAEAVAGAAELLEASTAQVLLCRFGAPR